MIFAHPGQRVLCPNGHHIGTVKVYLKTSATTKAGLNFDWISRDPKHGLTYFECCQECGCAYAMYVARGWRINIEGIWQPSFFEDIRVQQIFGKLARRKDLRMQSLEKILEAVSEAKCEVIGRLSAWKPIATAPNDKFVLVRGPSGYTTTDKFVILARREPEYRPHPWRIVGGDALSDFGWVPEEWMECPQ